MSFDGVILAGGAARRLGGVSKPALQVGPRRLLDVAIDALAGANQIVVVGPRIETGTDVMWIREDPPRGGPVAAIAAALPYCSSEEVVVLAADLPFITAAAIAELRSQRRASSAAIAVDEDGRDQPLLASYDRQALQAAVPDPAHGAPAHAIITALCTGGVVITVDLGGDPPVARDCDTPADLDRVREQIRRSTSGPPR